MKRRNPCPTTFLLAPTTERPDDVLPESTEAQAGSDKARELLSRQLEIAAILSDLI